jgi:hypothetical protein
MDTPSSPEHRQRSGDNACSDGGGGFRISDLIGRHAIGLIDLAAPYKLVRLIC